MSKNSRTMADNRDQVTVSPQALAKFIEIFELGYNLGFSDADEGVHVSLRELAILHASAPEEEHSKLESLIKQFS